MVAVYLDDILVSGRTYKEARENLVAAGLRPRLEKCAFMQKSCTYLGHRLDAEGIHPTNEKLLALQQAPFPTCVTELRSYVGLVNYYHKFLKNVSAVLKPLYELLQSGTSWHWGLSQQRAFEASKALLQSSKVLVHYNSRLPLVLSCDASPYGIGAVLSHRMADGSYRPIAFASRTLAPAEKRYAQIEREGLAIVFGVIKFHKYVYGRDFEIQTAHMPLLGLMSEDKLISPLARARIQRWALTLSNYQYHLRYKQGAQNRLPVLTPVLEVPVPAEVVLSLLAGHPRSGCPARLRGHKGSGLWKVWTVPSPPLPPLPSPPLPCPALPCPPLPPPLPSPPIPPSLPRAKFDQAGSSRLAEITARRSARV